MIGLGCVELVLLFTKKTWRADGVLVHLQLQQDMPAFQLGYMRYNMHI